MKTFLALSVCILVFFGGVMIGLILSITLIQNSPSMAYEDWQITDVCGAEGTNGWIAVTVSNFGIAPVTLVKTSINLVKQSTYPSLPLTLQQDTSTILNMTMNVSRDSSYYIRVYNSNGNHSEVQWEVPFSFMGSGEQLNIGSPYGWDKAAGTVIVNVNCPGGSAVTIDTVRVNGTQVTYTPLNAVVSPTNTVPLTIANGAPFQSGYFYQIVVVTDKNHEFQTTGICP